MNGKYDLVVVGAGTGGLVPAVGAASLGAKVALVERDRLGGECLYYGCVPTKALVRSAKVASLVDRADEFGLQANGAEVDFPAVMDRMRRVIEKVGEADEPARFRKLGVDLYLEDEARFASPQEVSVDGRRLRSRGFIVATGSRATVPPIAGIEEAGYITHVEALALDRLPESVVIVGAGPIGCEFAQIFTRFGSKVTLISSSSHPLPKEDPEVGETLKNVLVAEGVNFLGGYRAAAARKDGNEKVVTAREKGTGREVEARGEALLVAAGRAPNVESLALEKAGVELKEGWVAVDDALRTSVPNIYAAGDVTGKYLFTHVAEYQGRTAVGNALFPYKRKANYRVVPWTTFTDPEVARVGLTEEEAREQHDEVDVFRYPFDTLDRAVADGETEGFVKVVTGKGGKVLGAHIIGPEAGNLIMEFVLAMQNGVPIQGLSTTIHVYPTLSEVNRRAADNYYREKLFSGRNQKLLSAFFGLRRRLGRR